MEIGAGPVDSGAGHADGENAGFLRAESIFALVAVTDEDDCSVADAELFDRDSSRYTADLNLRCFRYPEALFPVRRYVDGLLAMRRSRPEDIVFSIVAGVPADLVSPDTAPDYDRILDDPRMQERVDPDAETPRLVPSCDDPERGVAFPPRRLVRTARGLEARDATATVGSICQQDFTPAIQPLLEGVGSRLSDRCAEP